MKRKEPIRIVKRPPVTVSLDDPQLWDTYDNTLFLSYCPDALYRCFHSVDSATIARSSELLNVIVKKVKVGKDSFDIELYSKEAGRRIVEVHDPVATSHLKTWLKEHPDPRPNQYLFVKHNKQGKIVQLTAADVSTRYTYYKRKVFPKLLKDLIVPESVKSEITKLLTKSWTPFTIRHSAIVSLHKEVNEDMLRAMVGWRPRAQK